jgi:tetratricopeptide (TPR) repeat protein
VLFYAQSGTGKTSLLNAKVIPLLEAEGFDVLPLARVQGAAPQGINPGEIQNIFVFNTLMSWMHDKFEPNILTHMSLADYLWNQEQISKLDGQHLARAIIFDQFEELFTQYQDRWQDRKGFFEQVRDVLKGDDYALRVMFSIREDYIARLDPFTSLLPERLRTRFRLERLRKGAALSAITGPLTRTSRTFAPGVAEKLVDDLLESRVETDIGEIKKVVGEFVEPVQLQVVCQNLWQELPTEVTEITERHLQEFGTVDRPLVRLYESAIYAASAETEIHQTDLRQWCERWLITSTGTRGIVHRGPQLTEGMPNRVLEIFEDRHMIGSEWRAGAHWYELTHDRFVDPIRTSNLTWNKRCEEQAQRADALLREPQHLLGKGDRLARRDYDKAIECCKEALSISNDIGDHWRSALALTWGGDIFRRQAAYDEALEAYLPALQIERDIGDEQGVVMLLCAIGSTYHELGRYDDAIQCFTECIDMRPDDPVAYDGRAGAYWYSGRYKESVDDYTKEIDLDPYRVNAYNGRGQVRAELGDYAEAIRDLDRAIELGHDDRTGQAYARNGRALAYAGLGQYERALKDFAASIRSQPGNAWVYYNRAVTYEWMGRPDLARDDLVRALKKDDPALTSVKRERAQSRLHEMQSSAMGR